jgi:hypothetical protein
VNKSTFKMNTSFLSKGVWMDGWIDRWMDE